jgi:parvulin-like peptidyl-prolyl isomerase
VTQPETEPQAGATSRLRRLLRAPLLHFIVIGVSIYIATSLVRQAAPAVLEVNADDIAQLTTDWQRSTGRMPSEAELDRLIDQFVDDALLIQVARSLGWDRNDPVIQRRLIQNLRFIDPAEDKSDAQILREAYALEMEQSDIVVRRRLLERMRLLLADNARSREPTEAQLQRYLEEHEIDFVRPSRIRLTQVHLSRDRRGEALHSDALALVRSLEQSGLDPATALAEVVAQGDPFLLQASLPLWSQRRLSERLGPGFAKAVFDFPLATWSGPAVSSYGEHAVWVHERQASELPALHEIRDKVIAELHREWEAEAMREALTKLRSRVEIRIASRDHPADQPSSTGSADRLR